MEIAQKENPKASDTIEGAMKVYQNKFRKIMEERHGRNGSFEGVFQEVFEGGT